MSLIPPKLVFPSIAGGFYGLQLTELRTKLQDVATWADAGKGVAQVAARRTAALAQTQALSYYLGSTGLNDGFVYNWNPSVQFPKFKAAKANVTANSARGKIACVGDSTTVGYGAGTEGGTLPMTNCRLFGMPARLAYWLPKLSAGSIPASHDNFFGMGNTAINSGIDSRIVTAGTTTMAVSSGFGGPAFQCDASGEGVDFTPTFAFDTVEIYYLGQNASVTVAVDGGATLGTRFFTNNSQVNVAVTTGITLATHTLNIRWNAGPAYVSGIVCYDSTTTRMEVYNGGSGGSKASDWNDTQPGWGRRNGAVATAADLYLVNLGINDSGNSTDAATWYSQMDNLVGSLKAVGDVILFMPTPVNGSNSATFYPLYAAKLVLLCQKYNVPLVSWLGRYKSFTNLQTNWSMTDNTHPPASVYDDEAKWLAEVLLNI